MNFFFIVMLIMELINASNRVVIVVAFSPKSGTDIYNKINDQIIYTGTTPVKIDVRYLIIKKRENLYKAYGKLRTLVRANITNICHVILAAGPNYDYYDLAGGFVDELRKFGFTDAHFLNVFTHYHISTTCVTLGEQTREMLIDMLRETHNPTPELTVENYYMSDKCLFVDSSNSMMYLASYVAQAPVITLRDVCDKKECVDNETLVTNLKADVSELKMKISVDAIHIAELEKKLDIYIQVYQYLANKPPLTRQYQRDIDNYNRDQCVIKNIEARLNEL